MTPKVLLPSPHSVGFFGSSFLVSDSEQRFSNLLYLIFTVMGSKIYVGSVSAIVVSMSLQHFSRCLGEVRLISAFVSCLVVTSVGTPPMTL